MKKRYKYPLYFLAALLATSGITACHVYSNIGGLPDETRFAHLPYYQNGRFVSPEELTFDPEKITGKGGWLAHKPYAPKSPLPMIALDKSSFGEAEPFAYYWLGHSAAILELNRQRILTDPVFDNAAPIPLPFVVPRFQAAPIERKALPPIDVVLITHDHYDHLEAQTMRHLANKATHFVTTLGVGARLQSWNVPPEKITELGWGDSTEINGVKYTAEPTVHYSRRNRDDRNKTLWAAFVLEGAGKRIYWSGDSGYGKHFVEAGKKYGGFDIAFMEIDAANPGWANTHMFPEEAVQATQDVNARIMLPIHWGVFNLGRNPWDENIRRAAAAATTKGVRMDMPKMGEKYTPDTHRQENWWEGIQ